MSNKRFFLVAVALVSILVMLSLAACGQEAAPAEEAVEEPAEEAAEEPAEEVAEEAAEEPAEEAAEEPAEEAAEEPVPVPVDDIHFPIYTTATDVVGVGTYVAGQAFAVPAGRDPEVQPMQAVIIPYGLYPNLELESIEDFEQPEELMPEGWTYEWAFTAAEGSASELMNSPVAIFMADVEGEYTLTLTVTDADGATAEDTWTVTATTFSGGLACAGCHADQTALWAETGHASLFANGIDGIASDHYSASCIPCHTTGFNNAPEAVNGGFDDLARDTGWMFPAVQEEGNFDALVADYPTLAPLATIGCESCHGPGGAHMGTGPIDSGVAEGTCAACHAEFPRHYFPMQWDVSGHGDMNSRAFTYPIGETRTACVRCHSGLGYMDFANGVPEEERRTDYQPITCAVCHDPHDATNPAQLRVYDSTTLVEGLEVTGVGASATCMSCHNDEVDAVEGVEGEEFDTGHYSTAAELMLGTGGYTWGQELPSSPHGMVVEDTCVTCHMAPTTGSLDEPDAPGRHQVGEHTFQMTSADGVENIGACTTCHADATAFDFEAGGDYDGDGAVETNEEELEGLRELLRAQLEGAGVVFLESHPYFEIPEGADVNVLGGVFNYQFTHSGGSSVHNLDYVISLLQLSYEMVAGEPVPGADLVE
jgi:hypothetical protein